MPDVTHVKKFVESLRTGRTDTTKVLEKLFGSKQALQTLQNHPNVTNGDFGTTDALSSGPGGTLPQWAKDELRGQGPASNLLQGQSLTDAEIDHIDKWPAEQREKVRAAAAAAITSGNPLQFSWELHAGNKEAIDPQNPAPGGTITFRSPRQKVKVSQVTWGDISVDV